MKTKQLKTLISPETWARADVDVREQRGERIDRSALFAPRDRSEAHALDLGEERRTELIDEDLADERAEPADILAQRLVGGDRCLGDGDDDARIGDAHCAGTRGSTSAH